MKKYLVLIPVRDLYKYEIDANSKKEALSKASLKFNQDVHSVFSEKLRYNWTDKIKVIKKINPARQGE